MPDTRYNGWSNYETWNCSLWIDNEQGSYDHWQERTKEVLQEAIDDNESEPKTFAAIKLVEELDEWIVAGMPETFGMYSDLLSAAVREINTREIVEHWLADIDLWSAGWNMPGYMPDNPPALFMEASEARSYIADEIDRDGDTLSDEYKHRTASRLIAEEIRKGAGEYGQTIGAYHYFVTKL